jgi:hypothetical protein
MVLKSLTLLFKESKLKYHLINTLKPRGNYRYHLLYQSVMLRFVFVSFA